MSNLKKTGLHSIHVGENAKLVPFAGYEMPLQYTSIQDEHNAVRQQAGIFDVSHMGELLFSGPDALRNVQRLVSNNVEKLSPNAIVYSGLLYPEGTFVDDVLVYKFSDEKFFMCVNAANKQKDYEWIKSNLEGDLEYEDASERFTQIAVQGPKTMDILAPIVDIDLSSMQYYRFEEANVAGVKAIISRTGYTGEFGFELYFAPEHSERVWQAVRDSGLPHGLKPAGLGCRDTLRLEAGMALY